MGFPPLLLKPKNSNKALPGISRTRPGDEVSRDKTAGPSLEISSDPVDVISGLLDNCNNNTIKLAILWLLTTYPSPLGSISISPSKPSSTKPGYQIISISRNLSKPSRYFQQVVAFAIPSVIELLGLVISFQAIKEHRQKVHW